jgi:hypothetical protein
VYATSAGSVAQDGTGRNGLFTSHLLKNLKTPGLEVTEIFRRTGFEVSDASNRKQVPAVSVQFFGNAYFSKPVVAQAPFTPPPAATPVPPPEPPKTVTVPVQPPETPVTASSNQPIEMPEIVIAPSNPAITPQPVKLKREVINPVACGFMNITFGLGSYMQGDILSGAIITSGYAATIGLLAWELSMSINDSGSGIPGNIGIAAGIGTLVFGFVKPFLFNRNRRIASAIDNFDVSLVSSERSKSAVAVKYTHSF